MKALVTGAGGFIGQRLVERLRAGNCDVVALIHHEPGPFDSVEKVDEVLGDIRDVDTMKAAAQGCDTVFHLAGRVHALSDTDADDALYDSLNIEGTRNVLEAAIAQGVERFVFFSSVKVLGEGGPERIDEDCEGVPETAYGRSKLTAENLVLEYGKQGGMHVTCLRLPLVYGPGNKGNLFRMIAAIDRGLFPPLPAIGNRRSMVHVSNVVESAWAAATNPNANGRRYIVADAEAYSTDDLYRMICHGLGRKTPRWSIPTGVLQLLGRIGDLIGRARGRRFFFDSDALDKLIGSAWYSSDNISRELGYQPAIEFRESLPELIDWYRASKV
jgi:nucleoside-diphosphate-sugar epimerase